MFFAGALALFPLLAAVSADNAGLMAIRPSSDLHYRRIEASGQRFWIGRSASTYCPSNVPNCPSVNSTSINLPEPASPGSISLRVQVPGGQRLYVAPDGALAFTVAHSASMPGGSIDNGFVYTPKDSVGTIQFLTPEPAGFFACNAGEPGQRQIFVSPPAIIGNRPECTGFQLATTPSTASESAWQYT